MNYLKSIPKVMWETNILHKYTYIKLLYTYSQIFISKCVSNVDFVKVTFMSDWYKKLTFYLTNLYFQSYWFVIHLRFFLKVETEPALPKTNGFDKAPKAEMPQPAPRRINSVSSTESVQKPLVPNNVQPQPSQKQNSTANPPQPPPSQNHKSNASASSLDGDETQVLPKPITNEEFQAMIPAHFLKNPPPTEPTHAVTVTIKKPDPIELPPPPTGPGRVTETITKSTFTETVVTRITDNTLVVPVIIEVCPAPFPHCMNLPLFSFIHSLLWFSVSRC